MALEIFLLVPSPSDATDMKFCMSSAILSSVAGINLKVNAGLNNLYQCAGLVTVPRGTKRGGLDF